jgi:hypothetical protein
VTSGIARRNLLDPHHNDAVDKEKNGAEREPSRRLVEQRIRNRVIEYFELVGRSQSQRDYEASAPAFVNVPYEIINQWEDWVPEDPRRPEVLSAVYSPDEVQVLGHYHGVWEIAADAVPDDYPSLAAVQALPQWEHLTEAAASAGNVFARRGKLPEDQQVS